MKISVWKTQKLQQRKTETDKVTDWLNVTNRQTKQVELRLKKMVQKIVEGSNAKVCGKTGINLVVDNEESGILAGISLV